jgi:hypothetical protein
MSAQSYADSAPAIEPVPSLSRRSMLRGAAGAGAVGLAAAAAAKAAAPVIAVATSQSGTGPASGTTAHSSSASAGAAGGTGAEPVVVHLRDAKSGEMDIFAGTSYTRLRDPDLAARLTRAVR